MAISMWMGYPARNSPQSILTVITLSASTDYTGMTRGQAWYMDMLYLTKGAGYLQSHSTFNKGLISE